ncbi:molybdopterin oxidoreductase family protein [Brevibacillus humidisoli]|uniref:assimilatory nitrate reductase catalytic subunit NasC n=1 Tax=Brevibacillus humidisoli TaxID=2895522 RepID=UPI001E563F7B|nr:molybdopterin oxidoreductase family protein [Brevibacillus humidisoli]UFJ39619.1 molybdopterin oxidoreductase family protein [Brevibacillus humidisoli]
MRDDLYSHFRKLNQTYTVVHTSPSQCPYCSMQCTMLVHQERSPFTTRHVVSANKEDPVVHGKMCVKGIEAHVPAFDKSRLTTPLLRQNGQLVPVSWSEAMNWFATKVGALQQSGGTDAVGVYGGGSLTNEESYLLGKFARVALRTRFIDYNGRFCMSSAATAANLTFGIDRGLTNPLSDIPLAQCLILAGTNIADCQPTMMPYLRKAKANGAFIIAIDPRVTGTTRLADLHIQVKPGADAALVDGMLKVMLDEGLVDWSFVKNHTRGAKELIEHLATVRLDRVAEWTGVPEEQIVTAARAYGQAETGMVFTARGVEQHVNGVSNVRNLLNLVLLSGKIGKPGCGYGAVTGQGNGQGGREHGQKADQLPGYRLIEHPEHRRHIADIWGIKEAELPRKGVSAYEMFAAMQEKKLRGLIVMSSNPVVSAPNAHKVEEALRSLDLLVVVDMFLSETAELADLVLPAASHLEDEGTMTTLEGRVTLRTAAAIPPGLAKCDWQIIGLMAEALGKGSGFRFTKAEEIFNELRRASQGGLADYAGISYQRIQREKGVFWPCGSEEYPGIERLFEDGRFFHSDGKAVLYPAAHLLPLESPDADYPLTLTTGRVMHHYLSGTQTRRTPALLAKVPEPYLQIHPKTAKRVGLSDGAPARVMSRRGEIVLSVKVSQHIRPDTVFVPFHWGKEQCINRLTLPELDPQSRMPSFKACAIRVEPVAGKVCNQSDTLHGEERMLDEQAETCVGR